MATGEFDIRHRLVGAAALVLAGVFLIPWLLNTLGGAPEQRPARVKAVAPSPDEFRSRIIPKGDPDGPPSAVNGTGVRVTPVPRVTIPSEPLVPAPAEQPERAEQPEPETPAATAAAPAPAPQRDSVPPEEPEEPEDRQADTSATLPAQPSARPTAAAGGGARDSVPAPGWVVRVGTFTEGENAERLVARLRDGGFSPSSSPVQIQGREATRVWLGPFEDRAEAIRVRSRVFDSVGEKGFIIRQE